MWQGKLFVLLLVCIISPGFTLLAVASTPRACGDDLQSTIGQMLPQLPAYANRAFNRRRPPQEPYTPTYVILAGNPEFEPLCRETGRRGDGDPTAAPGGRRGDGERRSVSSDAIADVETDLLLGRWGSVGPTAAPGVGPTAAPGVGTVVSNLPPPPPPLPTPDPLSSAPLPKCPLAPCPPSRSPLVQKSPGPLVQKSPCPPSPGGTGEQQAFITTLERQYTPNGVVFLQRFHWLFLTKTADGWELVQMFSIQGPTSGQPPTPPEESRDSFIGEAIRSWLQDCRPRKNRGLRTLRRPGGSADSAFALPM